MGALKRTNKDRAAVCANELAEVRKLLRFLSHVHLAIERVVLRLETIKELSDIVVDLKPALKLLQGVSKDLFQVLPEVSTELDNVNSAITETLSSTKIRTDESIIPVGKKTEAGEDILKEVSSFLEQKTLDNLPEPPISLAKAEQKAPVRKMVALSASSSQAVSPKEKDPYRESSQRVFSLRKSKIEEISLTMDKSAEDQPSIEELLLEYVRKSNGEINLSHCSNELNTSHKEIQKALESLGNKGRIKYELKSPE